MSKEEVLNLIDHWAVKHEIFIGDHEVAFAVDEADAESPYLVASVRYDNPFGAPMYSECVSSTDYLEMMGEFVARVQGQLEKMTQQRQERKADGVDMTPLGTDACLPGSQNMDYTGQVVVIRATALRAEYATPDYQLCLAERGNGCRPDGHGQAVYHTTLYSGERGRWNRTSIEGIADPAKLPAWAVARLEILREQEKVQQSRENNHENDR